MPKVVVIIPTLNEERFIGKCLDSVMRQTFPFEDMEVFVVDGGSEDKTKEIVSGYCWKFHNIKILHNSKKIQSVAFNLGVAASSAPIIVRLDAHALYDSRYIELCVKHISTQRYGNVGGRWTIAPQHSRIVARANAVLNSMKFGIGGAAFRIAHQVAKVDSVPFGCYLRSVVQEIGPVNESLPRGEDNEYNYRIRSAGYDILFDPEIRCTYFARDSFRASVKQMYANGYSVGILLHVCRNSVSLRHLIPFLFVCSITCLLIASVWIPSIALTLLCVELSIYFFADIMACVHASARHGWDLMWVLPALIFAVHVAYGMGTAHGLIRMKY